MHVLLFPLKFYAELGVISYSEIPLSNYSLLYSSHSTGQPTVVSIPVQSYGGLILKHFFMTLLPENLQSLISKLIVDEYLIGKDAVSLLR